ncbi:MAG TPA: hypothetical protein VEQ58_11910, partial [Polyangiaceae bacterium]|nr:hypothetical protein [Polyangiaceae bacterium]
MQQPRLALSVCIGAVVVAWAAWWGLSSRQPHVSALGTLRPHWRATHEILASAPPPRRELAVASVAAARLEAEAPLPHSHPITAAHQRIYRENSLLGRLNAAMDLGDT